MGKGDSFERAQCRFLSRWWSQGERDDIFWRNRRHQTKRDPEGKHQLGDVTTTTTEGIPFIELFNVELKSGYSKVRKGKKYRNVPWDLLELIDSTTKNLVLLSFWDQVTKDAELSKRIPLLIFKRDYHVPVVCIYGRTFKELQEVAGRVSFSYIKFYFSKESVDTLVFIREEEFFRWLTPEVVLLLHRRRFNDY